MTRARMLWLAKQARSGFDTLELPEAVDGAKADLDDIIAGLEASDGADDSARIPLVVRIEGRVRPERLAGLFD